MTLSQSGHRIITVFGCSFAIFSITLASCSWCFARSGRLRRRAFFAHCKCCRGFIRNGSGGSSIIGIYPSLTVSSPCCTHWALHRRCNVGAFRTPVTLVDARRCRPTQLSFLHKAHFCDRHHIASAMAEMPMPADRDPAIIDAARRLRPAPVPRPLQLLVQLALDYGLDKAAHPITHRGFNRIEPIIEKIHSCIGDRLRGIRLCGNALHGVVSYPTLKRRMIRG
jgi:hypothetical protein